jgi:hypothetical protein
MSDHDEEDAPDRPMSPSEEAEVSFLIDHDLSAKASEPLTELLEEQLIEELRPQPISRRGRTNLFFFLGSLFYVWVAIWDLPEELKTVNEIKLLDKDELVEFDLFDSFQVAISPYKAVAGMAALCYVFDALVEIAQLPSAQATHHLMHNVRRHIPFIELSVGVTFGLSAILDFCSSVTSDDDSDTSVSKRLHVTALHIYLLNCLLLLIGKRFTMKSVSTSLEVVGDVLFVTGSVNDVFLAYWYRKEYDEEATEARAMGDLFSAILWLIDALLYIIADCCSTEELNRSNYEVIDDEVSSALCSAAASDRRSFDTDDELEDEDYGLGYMFELPPLFSCGSNEDSKKEASETLDMKDFWRQELQHSNMIEGRDLPVI